MYPVMLDLTRKKIVIIGGGRIASRKVRGLTGEGADVTVIAPEIDDTIQSAGVRIIQERFDHDLSAYDIIFIATDDPEVNRRVMLCVLPHQLVNDCTYKQNSNFFNMASFRVDDARIMISTEGKSPERSKALKHQIQSWLSDDMK